MLGGVLRAPPSIHLRDYLPCRAPSMTETIDDPIHIDRILEERARALAHVPPDENHSDESELVVLALGAERYGLDILQVQSIQPLAGLARVPGLPPFWAGLVNMRGRLYPVLNLHRYLALPGQPAADGKVIVVAANGLSVALWVDDV